MKLDDILEKPVVMLTASDIMLMLDTNKREILAELRTQKEPVERLLTVKEAAKIAGCSESKIRVLIASCKLNAVREFGGVKIRYSELIEKMKS